MQRIAVTPRPDWQKRVESIGFAHHTSDDGSPYWNESACYLFTTAEIDTLEAATLELNRLCLEAVEHILRHSLWDEFQIPPLYRPWIRRSWDEEPISIVGRFDLLYDGVNPPKLAEYNADTPTALIEAALAQWFWLQDVSPESDQFNSLHEKLIDAWREMKREVGTPVTFAAVQNHLEDFATVTYLRDVAEQAGIETQYLAMHSIGWNDRRQTFVDLRDNPLPCVFKLYPWEWMMREEFGKRLPTNSTRWLEPPWKVLLSNKAILPLLWKLYPDHQNLLPASFELMSGRSVRKPTQGREGANIAILDDGGVTESTGGEYTDEPVIYQQFMPLPRFDGQTAILGSWMINGEACGMGVREDAGTITTNLSRFVPHRMIADETGIVAVDTSVVVAQ